MMKFLIVNFGSECDVIFSTVMIENIRAVFNESQIDFFVCSDSKPLLDSHKNIHEVLDIERSKLNDSSAIGRFFVDLSIAYKIRQNKYDTIFVLSESDRNARVVLPSGASVRVGIKPRESIWTKLNAFTDTYELIEPKHIVEVNLDAMRAIGLSVQSKVLSLNSSEESIAHIEALLKKYDVDKFVHLNVLDAAASRSMSDEHIVAIVDFIEIVKDTKVVLTTSGGEYENSRLFSILGKTKSKPVVFVGSLNMNDIIALSSKAMLFVGINTPILHIAASQNIPTVAFFGPDDINITGTWDNNNKNECYASKASKQHMGKHTVFQSAMECAPCRQEGCDDGMPAACLSAIDIEQVKKEIEKYI